MTSRLGPQWAAVMALALSSSGLWAQYARVQDFYIWPDAGPYLNRQLGSTMAADGDNLVLSLQYAGDGFDGGSVVFMRRASGGWTNSWAELERVDGPASGAYQLGSALAIDGDRALVTQTEFGTNPTVSLYQYTAGSDSWLDDVVDVPAPVGASVSFGQCLAIENDLLAVGDPGANRVYLYRDTGAATTLLETIAPISGSAQAFGTAISMSQDVLAVGDPLDGPGRVDLFNLNGGAGSGHITQLDITLASIDEGDEFGVKLALDGYALGIGATGTPPDGGRVLIYEYEPQIDQWLMLLDRPASNGLGGFPASIDVEDGMVVVGAPGTPFSGEEGVAMVFRRNLLGNWVLSETLGLSSNSIDAYAGRSVALAYGQALVGAPGRTTTDGVPQNTGAIACYNMDCDSDGVPDVVEIALGTEVDYDLDGVPDYCELDEYVLVPLDYPTIQAAIAGAAGRTILLQPGNYSEEVVIDGVVADIRAFVPSNPPVWSTGYADGTAIDVDNTEVELVNIVFDTNRMAIDAGNSLVEILGCTFSANGVGVNLSDSDLVANDSNFTNNVTISDGGSAIRGSSSQLVLNSCDFIGNGGNTPAAVWEHKGGAIQLANVAGNGIIARYCRFENNEARVEHSQLLAGFDGTATGGAVYAGQLTLSSFFLECEFINNSAVAAVELNSGGFPSTNTAGSAVLYAYVQEESLGLSSCQISGSEVRALDMRGGTAFFGAEMVYVEGFNAELNLTGVLGQDSQAVRVYYHDGSEEIQTYTDAIFTNAENVEISTSTFMNSGGFRFDAIFPENTLLSGLAFEDCGPVYVRGDSACTNSYFEGTRLRIDGNVSSCNFERIDLYFGAALTTVGTITDCTFHQIAAPLVIDGGTEALPLEVSGTTICGNAAPSFTSDLVWVDRGNNMIEGGPNGTDACPAGGTINVPADQNSIDDALMTAVNGDTIVLAAGTYGESIDARGFGQITIAGSGTGVTTIDPPDGEAGVRVADGTVVIRDLTISGGSPGVDADRGTVYLSNVVLENNSGSCGAGMRLAGGYSSVDGDGAEAYLQNTLVSNNISTGDGGGICVEADAALTVAGGTFKSNIAGGNGGAIHVADGARELVIDTSSFSFNSAVEDGGAVNAGTNTLSSFVSSSFLSNSAGRFGGGAQVVAAELTTCTFMANDSGEVGGGLRTIGTSVLSDCDFQSNISGNGGGLAATAIETYVDGFTACGNVGGDWYGNVLEIEGVPLYCSSDCNSNGIPDADEIKAGTVSDCNGNLIPDECEDLADVDGNGTPDECDPTGSQQTLIASIDVVDDLDPDAIDVLVRPLFRNGLRTHDLLVLTGGLEGAITTVIPDSAASYAVGSTLLGSEFERCCVSRTGESECLNNGPAGASKLAFARGDVVISHPVGDTGLFDEDLEMYYGCDAPAGAGLPAPITDYDLAPDTDVAISLRYVEEEDEGGLASSNMPLSIDRSGQTLTAVPVGGGGPKSTSGRRGSGQGGTGPYPGEDAVNDYGLSIKGIATGNFNGDASDDLLLLHPEEERFSVRNFTGLADFIDPDSGELVPSGATWSEPILTETDYPGVAVIAGQFVEFGAGADDGLDDVAVVVDTGFGLELVIWASTAPDTLIQVGAPYPLLGENFALGKSRVKSDGTEVVLIAQQDPKGSTYVDYLAYESNSGSFQVGWVSLGTGSVEAISTAPMRFGVSTREVVAVLMGTGESTSVHLLELSQRPRYPVPPNDECSSPIALADGDNAFSTLGATDSGLELPSECESGGNTQIYQDAWYTWTASCSAEVTISTCGTADFDTWLVAYEEGCGGFVLACNDQDSECANNTSKMTFEAIEGTTYHVRVGSWASGDQGSGTLTVTCSSGSVADLNGDGSVDGADLASLLGGWGQPGPTDLNGDGTTDGADLATLLGEWSI